MGVFKAYDIRGIYNKDGFDKELVYKIGRFLPRELDASKVLIGRDVRLSSDEIFEYLSKGITDSGADVYDLGLTTTPYVYFATSYYGFDASIQITASHNPKEYNGMKVSKKGSLPVGYDSGLNKIENLIKTGADFPKALNKGKIIDYGDKKKDYIDFLKKYIRMWDLNISCDVSNGMANLFVKDIFGGNLSPGKKIRYINDTLDGTFPSHEPNPLEQENCRELIEMVKKDKSDIGIIFDGDADRVVFVDDKARFVPPDMMIAVLAKHYLTKKGENILMDIRSSKSVYEYVEENGDVPHIWKVGHVFAKMKLREINAIFGGELAGHYYFKEFFNCDSAIFAAIICLNVIDGLKKDGTTLSSFLDKITRYANSGEINFRIEDKSAAMEKVKDSFTSKDRKPYKVYDFDGYRIEFDDYWFNIRMSNTEPYLRLVVEAKTSELLKEKVEEISSIIKTFK